MIPLFKSQYSLGRSILTLDAHGTGVQNGPDSIVDIAVENKFNEVFLVDDDVLEALDLLEGVDHGMYNRHRIPINCPVTGEKRNVWAYLYGGIVFMPDIFAEWGV